MQEAMIMRQQRHPNVLPLLAAFLSEAVLWMVMPYVAGGSAIHILNKKCPGVRPLYPSCCSLPRPGEAASEAVRAGSLLCSKGQQIFLTMHTTHVHQYNPILGLTQLCLYQHKRMTQLTCVVDILNVLD